MRILIYGCGQNGAQVFYILKHSPEIVIVGFLDGAKESHGQVYLGLPVFGDLDLVPQLMKSHGVTGGIVAIGNNAARARLDRRMRATGLRIVSAIHPKALIDSPARLGEGIIVEMGAAIHPEAVIGDGVFIGGHALVAHHSKVGEFSLLGGGVIFGGHVAVGRYSLVGVGVSIGPQLVIGNNVIVGVGAAVTKNLPDNVVAVGVPAKVIREQPPASIS